MHDGETGEERHSSASAEVSGSEENVRLSELNVHGERLMVISFPTVDDGALESLTPAEREVCALAASGCSNDEIADRRGTSVRTVANQMASIFEKLGVQSRAELARRVHAGQD